MVTCCLLCTCVPGLCILGELYVKYQYVILMYDPLSQKCIWLCLSLLTGRTFLRAFWAPASLVIILSLARIKFTFFLLHLIVNWIFVDKVFQGPFRKPQSWTSFRIWSLGSLSKISKVQNTWSNRIIGHCEITLTHSLNQSENERSQRL